MPEVPPEFVDSALLLFVLLNPFLLSVYLLDLLQALDGKTFRHCLLRGFAISGVAFVTFAFFGDAIFSRVLQVRFAAFLVFGGSVFFLVGLRFMLIGSDALREMRGAPGSIAGSIALPFLIGPGTVSASVLAGSKMSFPWAAAAIMLALTAAVAGLMLLKWLHDAALVGNQRLVQRYIDIVGRVSALIIGTIAVEMVLQGVELWLSDLRAA